MSNKLFTVILPAGTYFIGDPCYLFGHDDEGTKKWEDICNQIDEEPAYVGKLISQGDRLAFIGGTANGDGTFYDHENHEYGVDAGLLGCSPIEWNSYKYEDLEKLGHVHTFDDQFQCTWIDGNFSFGSFIIHTDYIGEEREEDDDDHYGDSWDEEEEDEEE